MAVCSDRFPAARHPGRGRLCLPLAPPLRLGSSALALVGGGGRGRGGSLSPFFFVALGALVQRSGRRRQARALAAEEGIQGIGQVVDEVPTVGHLGGVGCPVPRPFGIGAGAGAGDDRDAGMGMDFGM